MKQIMINATLFLVLGIIGIFKLKIHPFVEDNSQMKVSVVYKDDIYNFELEPYTELGEILEKIIFDDDVNFDAINENQILKHKDKIVIPTKKEIPCISINHASRQQLMLIHGIGPKMADRIIEYRELNGYFQVIEDIKQVKGIGDKTFEKMKDQICI